MAKIIPECFGSNPGPVARAENHCDTCPLELDCVGKLAKRDMNYSGFVSNQTDKAVPIVEKGTPAFRKQEGESFFSTTPERAQAEAKRTLEESRKSHVEVNVHNMTKSEFPIVTMTCVSCNHVTMLIEVMENHAIYFCDKCKQHFKVTPHDWYGDKLTSVVERFAKGELTGAFNKQEGGDHYKDMVIQPFEFLRANNVPHAEGEAIYRLLRWRQKGGIEDLRKVIHTVELMIEHEERKGK